MGRTCASHAHVPPQSGRPHTSPSEPREGKLTCHAPQKQVTIETRLPWRRGETAQVSKRDKQIGASNHSSAPHLPPRPTRAGHGHRVGARGTVPSPHSPPPVSRRLAAAHSHSSRWPTPTRPPLFMRTCLPGDWCRRRRWASVLPFHQSSLLRSTHRPPPRRSPPLLPPSFLKSAIASRF
jgi:hypothetical protein